mgnify:FL=1
MTEEELTLDKTPLTFGKYQGMTPDEVSEHDPSYIVWMYETIKPKRCSHFLYPCCLGNSKEDEEEEYDGPF